MDTALTALAEPRRQRILEVLRDRELSAGEIAAHFDVSRPAISQHLGVLKNAGLLTERREGTRRLYRLRPQGLTEIYAYLDAFWADGLQRLKLQAELEERITRATEEGNHPR